MDFAANKSCKTIDDWRLEATPVAKDELRARIHDIAKISGRKRTFQRAPRYHEVGGSDGWRLVYLRYANFLGNYRRVTRRVTHALY